MSTALTLSLSTGRKKIALNQAWLEKSAQGVWMKSVGGFHSLAFKGALWSRFSADGNSDFFGQEPHMPCLCVGWASVQKARASGGFSLAFSHQPSLVEVPGSPPVSGICCGAHLQQWVSLQGQQGSRCHAFDFSWQCEGGLHLLGFSGSCLCWVLCYQDPKVSISKLNRLKDTAEVCALGFFLKRNSVVNFLLSLFLLAFPGCFFSTGANFSETQNRTGIQLCVIVLAFVMQYFCFCQQVFSIPLFINPEFYCRNYYN